MVFKFLARVVQKNNKEYLEIGKARTRMTIDNGSLNFENLFNGNKVLGDTVNQFINDNWVRVFPEFNRPLFDIFSSILKKSIQNVFNQLSVDELFSQ